jgi:ArsR family transcriptional regulator
MKDVLQLLKALSDETRLRLAKVLLDNEWCVCELADALEVQQSNLSRHLAVLRHAGLLSDRKDGRWVYYTIARDAKPRLRKLLSAIGDLDSPRAQLDAERLQQRLAIRTNGKCCLGYGELPRSASKGRR